MHQTLEYWVHGEKSSCKFYNSYFILKMLKSINKDILI